MFLTCCKYSNFIDYVILIIIKFLFFDRYLKCIGESLFLTNRKNMIGYCGIVGKIPELKKFSIIFVERLEYLLTGNLLYISCEQFLMPVFAMFLFNNVVIFLSGSNLN
ncbi:hypothetical protein EDEG_00728 [Edhazardia aedis USNM 41457]|uniref:Uncharacterized protein n=1 Tax=Edhazardia aedis (strain USNM 41457) TaxID=1003232 RepID=J9DBU5_EDHAE|nr:hypothetical protein EDEG_00728 [Edhazardia aedis USNM 41457]|eukprot:EJW05196.1 hypothetical protein EDEG_00728 [Edhazardia aedis USNM 41457]